MSPSPAAVHMRLGYPEMGSGRLWGLPRVIGHPKTKTETSDAFSASFSCPPAKAQLKHPAACTPELLNALENQGVRKPMDEL